MAEVDLPAKAAAADAVEQPEQLPACDVVMKGGITSGVVYPGAVIALAQSFRFKSIGGTSAGAIAAGVCAAAEYGRQTGGTGGLVKLGAVTEDLSREDFLAGLFQATPRSRALFDLMQSEITSSGGRFMRAWRLARGALRSAPWLLLPWLLVVAAVVVLVWAGFDALPAVLAWVLTVLFAAPLVVFLTALVAAASLALVFLRAYGSLEDSGWGICPGTHQEGYAQDEALTEWLDRHIQACAGQEPSQPLTFRQLAEAGIELEMMTTDLSAARPVRCPGDLRRYQFRPDDLEPYFPDHVIAHMVAKAERETEGRYAMPVDDLPVLVGVRLSLSFPVLLSTIPLYDTRSEHVDKPSVFSDGGIASNFPIHFFDAWFPSRPTFGIDLAEHPEGAGEDVFVHSADTPPARRWSAVAKLPDLFGQIVDTMQNWRDTMQAELPGYRERVCQVRLKANEGGLRLKMDADLIGALMQRGYRAGEALAESLPVATPPTEPWSRHCLQRYTILMRGIQRGLLKVSENAEDFLDDLGRGLEGVRDPRAHCGEDFRAWAAAAANETGGLLACARRWGATADRVVDFDCEPMPDPDVVMRVVPKV